MSLKVKIKGSKKNKSSKAIKIDVNEYFDKTKDLKFDYRNDGIINNISLDSLYEDNRKDEKVIKWEDLSKKQQITFEKDMYASAPEILRLESERKIKVAPDHYHELIYNPFMKQYSITIDLELEINQRKTQQFTDNDVFFFYKNLDEITEMSYMGNLTNEEQSHFNLLSSIDKWNDFIKPKILRNCFNFDGLNLEEFLINQQKEDRTYKHIQIFQFKKTQVIFVTFQIDPADVFFLCIALLIDEKNLKNLIHDSNYFLPTTHLITREEFEDYTSDSLYLEYHKKSISLKKYWFFKCDCKFQLR